MKISCPKCKMKINIPKTETVSENLTGNYLRTYGWKQLNGIWHCKTCSPPSSPPSNIDFLRQVSVLLAKAQKEIDEKDGEIAQLKEKLQTAQETITTHEYTIQELQDELKVLQRETSHLRKGIDYL